MKLDRNLLHRNHGRGKYALILLRQLPPHVPGDGHGPVYEAIELLERAGLIDWGEKGTSGEFFVIRLKDRHASAALNCYAHDASLHGDLEWANEVREMADRAGPSHPDCKLPD